MAIEMTTVEIVSDLEEYRKGTFAVFGWNLESSRHVGNDIVRMKFSRDTEMKNYDELNEKYKVFLVKEEKSMKLTEQQVAMSHRAPVEPQFNMGILLCLLFPIPGTIALICYLVSYNAKKKRYAQEIEEYNKAYEELDVKVKAASRECSQLVADASWLINADESDAN